MRTRLLALLRLAAFTVVAALALLEVTLRVIGYSYSPLALLPPDNRNDHRPFHGASLDPRVSAKEPVTVFDPELLWVPNPRVGPVLASDGTRGGPLADARAQSDVLVVAVGDSNTMGPLDLPDHWPGYLQDLIALNAPPRRWRVVNAGVYGYSSFQGLRRTRQVLVDRPDFVYLSFGANDAHPVQRPDDAYAQRARSLARWQWLRLAPPLMHALWAVRDRLSPPGPSRHRVPLPDYRRNLEEMVRLCLAQGATPILLTRPYKGEATDAANWMTYAPLYNQATREVAAREGVELIDVFEAFRGEPQAFVDESHFRRRGHQALARLLLHRLEARGSLATGFVYRTSVDLGDALDTFPELDDGWHYPESWPDAPKGRWTKRAATLHLERRGDERGLAIDLELFNRTGHTLGRIEANGRPLLRVDQANGRLQRVLDISSIPDPRISVRISVDEAAGSGQRDPRELGVFVHSCGLRPSTLASSIRPGEVDDGRPELMEGFWSAEKWVDGRSGRWTRAQALLRLSRRPDETRLVVDLSLENPGGTTDGWLEVNGRRLKAFHAQNGRRTEVLDVGDAPGDELRLRIGVDRPFVPQRLGVPSRDRRVLGVFVHEARLERKDAPAR